MKTLLLFLSVFLSANLFGQNVYIPDANFKAYLVGSQWINTNGDTEIQVSEASSFNGIIQVNSSNISNLTGIEAFTSLTYLYCEDNELTSLDVSQNTALNYLWCFNNQLTSLDVSNNTDLLVLRCNSLQLTSLDVSQNAALQTLNCSFNQLACLNVKNGNNVNMMGIVATNNPNLTCIEVDNAAWSTSNWFLGIDPQISFSEDCNYPVDCGQSTAGLNNLSYSSKNLIQILDLMGRETLFKTNTPLIYVYDDGSTERIFKIEE